MSYARYLLFISLIMTNIACYASDRVVSKVVWLTTHQNTTHQLDNARKSATTDNFQYFVLDESQMILKHFESLFPAHLNNKPIPEREQYLRTVITPKLMAYTTNIMYSEMGISLAKLYKVERLPAVVINDQYVTYGMSVQESVEHYLKSPKVTEKL